jgi:hypothetical protein
MPEFDPSWRAHFSERELDEIVFCGIYAREFAHGTDGHSAKIIINKLYMLLEASLAGVTIEPELKSNFRIIEDDDSADSPVQQ